MTDPAAPPPAAADGTPPGRASGRGGRKRDPSRDAAIIEATVAVLAEVGYDHLTMDLVAARAKAGKATLYRRWASKADLVIDAVASIRGQLDPDDLPDTGSLRGDFEAVFVAQEDDERDRLVAGMGGLTSMLAVDQELADAAHAAVVQPFVDVNRTLMRRAVARGEIPADADIETIALVTPQMVAFRLMVQRQPLDLEQLFRLIDVVVLPALHATPAPGAGRGA